MVLKKLTLRGFKSFADKTDLEFGPGVTGIVGPNGCGKSNILDSLLWVLGEQNPRKLRGLQMQNVIFNGTQTRRPEGMAEVSLLLDNSERLFPVDFTEVLVTRRLFRNGESEYLINKTPCRLKDITELFMDTGIGKSTYSVLEQGRVEQILNSRPMDRRLLFEEAAGISKYKARRDEALRKLARTEQDLVRLNDILAELGRQVRSLKRQAGLAERYEKYFEELQGLELTLMARGAERLEQQIVQAERERKDCEDAKQATAAARAGAHAELAETSERLSAMDQQLHQLAEKQIALRGELERWDEKARSAQERQTELQVRTGRLAQEAEEAVVRLEHYRRTLEEKQAGLETDSQEAARIAQEAGAIEQRRQQLVSLVAKQETTVEELRKRILRLQNELTAGENDQRRIERERELISAQGQKLTQQQLQMAEEVAQLNRLFGERETVANETRSRVQQLERMCEETTTLLGEVSAEWESCCSQLSSLQAEVHAQSSRLASLIELERNREGYNDGVKFLLEERAKENSSIRPQVMGTLAELMTVEKGYETAIEIALAYTLQYLLVEREEEGARLLDLLARNRSGRAGFVPLDALRCVAGEPLPENLEIGGVRRAVDVVTFPEPCSAAAQLLFGDVLVAQNLAQAREAKRRWGNRCRVITLQGEMADTHGILSGGSHTEGGLLSRKREIADLEASLEKCKQQQTSGEARREELKQRREDLRETLDRARQERHECQILLAKADQELEALGAQRERLLRSQDQVSEEQMQRAQELSRLMEDARLVVERIDRYKQEFHENSSVFGQEEGLLNEKKEQLRQLEFERHGKEVTLAEKRKDLERGRAEVQSLSEQIAQLESLLAKRGEERETIAEQYEQAGEQIIEARRKSEELVVQVEAMDGEIARAREARAALADLRAHQEEKLAEIDSRRSSLDDRKVESESERVRLNLQKEDLARRFKHEFEKEYSDWTSIDRLPERPQKELEDAADELRNRIQRLGPVNRLAKQEFDEVNERFEFLSTQKDDLEKARANLMRTIGEIKRTARERFETVFAQIQENFRKTFRTMFGGGKADLILLDQEDIIESGIEIVAQPPGKNLQSISLMSGGEKALTAISLIFAIYLIKPSPFCILDEIDAPLDDVNIGRFTRVLRQFTDRSQFLIITHNKRTMETADAIYGVTMAQQGVSQIMSMNFESARQHATQGLDAPSAAEGPLLATTVEEAPSAEAMEEELPEAWSGQKEPEAAGEEPGEPRAVSSEADPDEADSETDTPRAKNGTKLEPVTLDEAVTRFDEEDFVPQKEKVEQIEGD